jgi:hypothetical protein
VNYDVQPIGWDPDILKCFGNTFDELRLLLFCSSLPHLNDYHWHDFTSGYFLDD